MVTEISNLQGNYKRVYAKKKPKFNKIRKLLGFKKEKSCGK